ncbi:MAG: sortase [Solirubrobacteraceae bacterium]|jgi:sortase A|nr:sortase [Solirubrobacteraceae bacterium]
MTAVRESEPPAAGEARRRPGRARRALHTLSTILIVAGLLLLADAGLTVAWQEPLSALYAKVQQSRLNGRLDHAFSHVIATPAEKRLLAALPDDARRIAFAARVYNRRATPGDAVGRIRIPRIGLERVIVEGTGTEDLRKGPGHYPATPMPGAPGTVGIAGHRTTYGAPFRHVDRLKAGDRIIVEMPYATVTYRVERLRIVAPSATWVVDRRAFDRLVLTACHPLYSAAERIVVFAREVAAKPTDRLR